MLAGLTVAGKAPTVSTAPEESPSRTRLLRDSAFRSLWLARTISFTGDGITRTALVLLTARHGPAAVALVLLASTVPRFLGPVTGALADRWERRRLMRGCELGQAVLITLVAVTLPPLPVLLVLVLLATMLATVFAPASASCVPALVPSKELTRANALVGTAFNFQIALGPAIGGLAFGLAGPRVAFALDAATFLASAILLRGLPRLPPDRRADSDAVASVWASTLEGLRYVSRSPGLRSLVVALVVFVAFAAIDNVALVFLVEDELSGSATAYGLVQGCFGLGMLLASVGLSWLRRTVSSAVLLVTGAVAGVVGALATAVAPGIVAVGATQAVAGSGNGIDNIAVNTHVQRLVPTPMLGRAFGAISTSAQVGSGIAYVISGPLLAAVGPRAAFLIAGAGSALGLVLLIPALHATVPPRRA